MKARTYFDPATQPMEAKLEMGLIVANLVAAIWAFIGLAIETLFKGQHNLKAEIVGIGCNLIALGMFSLILPLWLILKKKASK